MNRINFIESLERGDVEVIKQFEVFFRDNKKKFEEQYKKKYDDNGAEDARKDYIGEKNVFSEALTKLKYKKNVKKNHYH